MKQNKVTELKRINPENLEALRTLAIQTFSETFGPVNSPENLKFYLDKAFTEEKLKSELNDPDSEIYFLSIEGSNAGYLKVNFSGAQTEINDQNGMEIERIYVLHQFHGQGLGQLLFQKALEIAKARELDHIWLGVWEMNTKAIGFYKRNGFVAFATHVFQLGDDLQTDIMMKLVLKE